MAALSHGLDQLMHGGMGSDLVGFTPRRGASDAHLAPPCTPSRQGRVFARVKSALRSGRYGEHVARVTRLVLDTRDLALLFGHVRQTAIAALRVEDALVHLLDGDQSGLEVGTEVGADVGLIDNQIRTLLAAVVAEGRTMAAFGAPPASFPDVPPVCRDGLPDSALAAPLFDGVQVVGALVVRARGGRAFSGEDVRFVETLSGLLAVGLQRARAEEALKHSQRLKSVGQLTGGIAHDFNNLLTVISGNLQVLEAMPAIANDPDIRHVVGAAARASRRGADLVGQLLSFSRSLVLHPVAVDMETLLYPLADMLRRTLDLRIAIKVDVAPACPPCVVDPAQIEAALLNLAINARDAMPDGGTLSFKAWPVERVPPEASVGAQPADIIGHVAVSVADTGKGMCCAVKQRALEPFFTTKEPGQGTGLGLSSVLGFVTQSHGAMRLESAVGAGTTVTLFLPRYRVAG